MHTAASIRLDLEVFLVLNVPPSVRQLLPESVLLQRLGVLQLHSWQLGQQKVHRHGATPRSGQLLADQVQCL